MAVNAAEMSSKSREVSVGEVEVGGCRVALLGRGIVSPRFKNVVAQISLDQRITSREKAGSSEP